MLSILILCPSRLIVRVKAALTQSLLIKTMKIRFNSAVSDEKKDNEVDANTKKDNEVVHEQSKVGMINNLMSTDLEQLTDARYYFSYRPSPFHCSNH